jgi:hypothetical protein
MRTTNSRSRSLFLILLASLLCASGARAQENAQKRPLSEKLRLIIDEDGVEAAQQWFEGVYPEQKDEYEVDFEGFATLGREYMEAGDYESGAMVMSVMVVAGQDAMPAAAMIPPAAASASGLEPVAEASVTAVPIEPSRARTDLERFYGLYGEPEQEDPVRGLIVTELCGGFLYVTTTWGDSSPWLMTSLSDTGFEYADSWISFQVEFQPGAGSAESVVHDLDFLPNPLPRLGPLPEGWEECVPDQRG